MIERDDHIPPLNELLSELDQVRQIAEDVFAQSITKNHNRNIKIA